MKMAIETPAVTSPSLRSETAGQPLPGTKQSVPDLEEQVAYHRAFEAVVWAIPAASAAQCPHQQLLVDHSLRHADPLGPADRPARHRPDQQLGHGGIQPRWLGGQLLRTESASGQGKQLGADHAWQGLVHHPAPLRRARTLVRQDLAAGGDRTGEVNNPLTCAWG